MIATLNGTKEDGKTLLLTRGMEATLDIALSGGIANGKYQWTVTLPVEYRKDDKKTWMPAGEIEVPRRLHFCIGLLRN